MAGAARAAGQPRAARAGGRRDRDRERPRPWSPRWDWDAASVTGAVGRKLPERRSPGPGSRQSPHGHHVAAAGAVLGQPVLGDGAAQPQPLHLQDAAIPRAPRRDVQLGREAELEGSNVPTAHPDRAKQPRQPPRPCACPAGGRLPQGNHQQPWPRAWTSKQTRGAEEEFGANAQDFRAAASVSKGPSLCEELWVRGRPQRCVYVSRARGQITGLALQQRGHWADIPHEKNPQLLFLPI